MHTFEKKFYLDIKSILTNRKKYINIYELLSYCILGFIFGIKDIRQKYPFLRAITNRLNFLSIILSSYKLLSLYKNIQNEKKEINSVTDQNIDIIKNTGAKITFHKFGTLQRIN